MPEEMSTEEKLEIIRDRVVRQQAESDRKAYRPPMNVKTALALLFIINIAVIAVIYLNAGIYKKLSWPWVRASVRKYEASGSGTYKYTLVYTDKNGRTVTARYSARHALLKLMPGQKRVPDPKYSSGSIYETAKEGDKVLIQADPRDPGSLADTSREKPAVVIMIAAFFGGGLDIILIVMLLMAARWNASSKKAAKHSSIKAS